jgi:hypothetical protein
VKARADLPEGTTITNRATITFDPHEGGGSALDTPPFSNRIDSTPPRSQAEALPAEVHPGFEVRWDGADDGAGVSAFNVYVAKDGGPLKPWLTMTPKRSARFTGEVGSRYAFLVQALDGPGNLEKLKAAAETQTLVVAPPPSPATPETPETPRSEPPTTAITPPAAVVTPAPRRLTPRRLSLTVKRGKRLTISGRLLLPSGVRPAAGCTGKVDLTLKGRRSVRKRVSLNSACRFSWRVKPPKGRLKLTARFRGNPALLPLTARSTPKA